ncbi:MAG TPA: dehydrogenase E1 component subunit alpha/beta [Candidatus Polarisedimenticolia bacterium]|nr:dehydrogenase E1 component subunit alpha/beta [Candidatus Polarisedimenticolia bacterium]
MPKKFEQKVTPIRPKGREVPDELLLALFRKMLHLYYIEERVKTFVRAGKVSFHASSRGHEKVQIAMSYLLTPGKDWFFPYYREKALMVGLGMPTKEIFLHMLSKADDPCGAGHNMSEHFSSKALRVVSPTACTGTQFLPAVGLARAIKLQGLDEIVYVSSGEGATSEGEFFEALNWAVREQLPVLFLIQNNGYAISVPQEIQTGSEVEDISRGFHMRALHVDGTRFTDMYNNLMPLIAEMRRGGGPRLIEAHVVRLDSHSSSDDQSKYRSQEELDAIRKEDPLAHTAGVLLNKGILDEAAIRKLHDEIKAEVEIAAEEADRSADPRPETAVEHIFSGRMPVTVERPPASTSAEPVPMVEAINHGLREEMQRDPKIVMWGEDVADPKGGVFGVTRGLGTAFPGRVTNSPLAEASIVGVAQGLSLAGYRPVVEIQFGDYSFPGYMQMRNEIPTLRWRSGGVWSCPMVVRIAVGGYIRGGPFHSQCIEALYAHTPGWYIAYPSNAADAKGLIKTACRMEDPVLFLEHKGLYRQVYSKSPEPDASYLLPFGRARIAREGADVTAVTWGSGVVRCERAADTLAEEGISVEVIDLRTIIPWDVETVMRSVRKTGKAIVVHEAIMTGGFGGEVASRIASDVFEHLDGPVKRVAAKDSFVAYAPSLEGFVLPSQDEVTGAVRDLARY